MESIGKLSNNLPSSENLAEIKPPHQRHIDLSTQAFPGQRGVKIQVREQRLLDYGRRRINLSNVEQLLDAGQTEAIGFLLAYCQQHDPQQDCGICSSLRSILEKIEKEGLDLLLPWKAGHLALPRFYEICAAANRLREK